MPLLILQVNLFLGRNINTAPGGDGGGREGGTPGIICCESSLGVGVPPKKLKSWGVTLTVTLPELVNGISAAIHCCQLLSLYLKFTFLFFYSLLVLVLKHHFAIGQ